MLDGMFLADGIVNFTGSEFVPERVVAPAESIIHRIPIIARVAQDLRTASGGRVWLNSAFRDWLYNGFVGGKETSLHPEGCAIDVACEKWKPKQVWKWAKGHPLAHLMGIGRYNTFTHIDLRGLFPTLPGAIKFPAPSRWDLRSGVLVAA